MKLIALVNSRSDPDTGYHSLAFEAEDYDMAHAQLLEALGEDDRLLSVRVDRSQEDA